MTPKEQAAMQQALMYLDAIINGDDVKPYELEGTALTLREALAEQAEHEPSIDFDKLHEMNMQYVECPACGSDMAMAYSPKSVEHEPIRFIWNGEGWIEADDYIWKTTDDHERRILYAAPVRTKDLTDDELMNVWVHTIGKHPIMKFARAVIAADREKNKCQ